MARAWLVHEGAVLTGPHGGRGDVRGAPDSPVLLEAREWHPDCACGERRECHHLCLEDAHPPGLAHCSRRGLCPGASRCRWRSPTKQSCCLHVSPAMKLAWLSELHTKGTGQKDSTANAKALDPAELLGVSVWGLGRPAAPTAQTPEVRLADLGSNIYPLDENTG